MLSLWLYILDDHWSSPELAMTTLVLVFPLPEPWLSICTMKTGQAFRKIGIFICYNIKSDALNFSYLHDDVHALNDCERNTQTFNDAEATYDIFNLFDQSLTLSEHNVLPVQPRGDDSRDKELVHKKE